MTNAYLSVAKYLLEIQVALIILSVSFTVLDLVSLSCEKLPCQYVSLR